jgi:hypothetical protein
MNPKKEHAIAACKAGLREEHQTTITKIVAVDVAGSDRTVEFPFSAEESALILEAAKMALTENGNGEG